MQINVNTDSIKHRIEISNDNNLDEKLYNIYNLENK
jgi:hypothetical protein